jgi:hypothetical protein
MHLVKSPGSLLKIMGIEDTMAFRDKVLARRDQLLAGPQSSSGFGEPALGNALQKTTHFTAHGGLLLSD